jgi:hypothetical protein
LLKKVVYAGSNDPAFKRASKDLLVLAEVIVTAKQVERWTERIGQERLEERDAAITEYMAKTLAQRDVKFRLSHRGSGRGNAQSYNRRYERRPRHVDLCWQAPARGCGRVRRTPP